MKISLIKKGAMFGLDARIALAIFGALSVISGAALYSAIQESKLTYLFTQIQEVEKALTAYYLDTGEYPMSNTPLLPDISEFISSTKAGWKGPYMPLELYGASNLKTKIGHITLYLGKREENLINYRPLCDDSDLTDCYFYIEWFDIDDNLKNALDEKIDGELGPMEGKIRVCPPGVCTSDGSVLYVSEVPYRN